MFEAEIIIYGLDEQCDKFMYEFTPMTVIDMTDQVNSYTLTFRKFWEI